jgi:hypothetical protein
MENSMAHNDLTRYLRGSINLANGLDLMYI